MRVIESSTEAVFVFHECNMDRTTVHCYERCEMIPLPDATARTAALAIHNHWISRYGFPKSLHSDLGPSFTSDLFKELCRIYGIKHTFASSQNHKSVSRAEGLHRIMLSLPQE